MAADVRSWKTDPYTRSRAPSGFEWRSNEQRLRSRRRLGLLLVLLGAAGAGYAVGRLPNTLLPLQKATQVPMPQPPAAPAAAAVQSGSAADGAASGEAGQSVLSTSAQTPDVILLNPSSPKVGDQKTPVAPTIDPASAPALSAPAEETTQTEQPQPAQKKAATSSRKRRAGASQRDGVSVAPPPAPRRTFGPTPGYTTYNDMRDYLLAR